MILDVHFEELTRKKSTKIVESLDNKKLKVNPIFSNEFDIDKIRKESKQKNINIKPLHLRVQENGNLSVGGIRGFSHFYFIHEENLLLLKTSEEIHEKKVIVWISYFGYTKEIERSFFKKAFNL